MINKELSKKSFDSDELQIKMKVNKTRKLNSSSSRIKKNLINEAKVKEFMKNQNEFDKLILSFVHEQRIFNKKAQDDIRTLEKQIKVLKLEISNIKKKFKKY